MATACWIGGGTVGVVAQVGEEAWLANKNCSLNAFEGFGDRLADGVGEGIIEQFDKLMEVGGGRETVFGGAIGGFTSLPMSAVKT